MLDTWFSSALWPFATLGWPEQTPDLETFYPGDVCSTGRDINFLWVSRMIWAGLELMGEIPFHDVNYHAMILAPDGRRMSKSLGTGIDPTELIAEHGADATRYGLLKMASTQDVRFSAGAIEEGRKLSNKLWNVSRLLLGEASDVDPDLRPRDVEERWILGRLDAARAELETLIPEFEFSAATSLLYHLTFDDFCDWYAEAIKPRLYAGDDDARATALAALERLLKLLHPVMPHVSEEIWSHLPSANDAPDRRAVARARRAASPPTCMRSTGSKRQRPSSGGAACALSWEATICGSSRPSSGPIGSRRTATSMPSGSASARRSRAPRACSPTSGSPRKRPPRSSRPSDEKLERYRRELDAISN